jgi:hypothetical protein
MTSFQGFPRETIRFLRDLSRNNEKAWFDAHREDYQEHYVGPALAFIASIGPRLQKISPSVTYEPKVNGSLFRINRDVRFSKDKRPYKDHLDLWFWHGDKRGWESPGFFFRLLPDRLILGAGMHRFEKNAARRLSSRRCRCARRQVTGKSGGGGRRGWSLQGRGRQPEERAARLRSRARACRPAASRGLVRDLRGQAGRGPRDDRLRRVLRRPFSHDVAGLALAARTRHGWTLSLVKVSAIS